MHPANDELCCNVFDLTLNIVNPVGLGDWDEQATQPKFPNRELGRHHPCACAARGDADLPRPADPVARGQSVSSAGQAVFME
jgi:hypothetical protein